MLDKEELLFDELYEKTKDCGRTQFIKLLMEKEKVIQELQIQNLNLRTDIMIQKKALPSDEIKDKTFYALLDMPTYAELKKQLKEILKIKITYDLKDMIICALRYAIGRKTYVTEEVSSYIKSHPELIDKRVKEVMLKDLKGIDRYYKENDIDYPIFKSLENWLNKIEV